MNLNEDIWSLFSSFVHLGRSNSVDSRCKHAWSILLVSRTNLLIVRDVITARAWFVHDRSFWRWKISHIWIWSSSDSKVLSPHIFFFNSLILRGFPLGDTTLGLCFCRVILLRTDTVSACALVDIVWVGLSDKLSFVVNFISEYVIMRRNWRGIRQQLLVTHSCILHWIQSGDRDGRNHTHISTGSHHNSFLWNMLRSIIVFYPRFGCWSIWTRSRSVRSLFFSFSISLKSVCFRRKTSTRLHNLNTKLMV